MNLKKIMWIISFTVILTLINCGGNSSQEAKKLLQKILYLMGIPQTIVVNICQDNNTNNICDESELAVKITLNKNDKVSNLLQKISKTSDGRYFLETYNIKKPILLELQDNDNFKYNNGKFTLYFNGFKTNEQNETKELSILESMIDVKKLTETDVIKIRNLNEQTTQDEFYKFLLKSFEENLNTLMSFNILTVKQATQANIKEMADRLIKDNVKDELPKNLNKCDSDINCTKEVLTNLDTSLKITSDDALLILIKSQSENNEENNPTGSETEKCVSYNETGECCIDIVYEDGTPNCVVKGDATP